MEPKSNPFAWMAWALVCAWGLIGVVPVLVYAAWHLLGGGR
jgi:hypothetical protein